MLRLALAAAVILTAAAPAAAQDIDLAELFTTGKFEKEVGLLQSRGDIEFVGDVWLLPGTADSSRAILGIALSNRQFEFTRGEQGWRAEYTVTADIEPEGGTAFQQRWERTLEYPSFDDTQRGAPGVFQAELPLAPGKYRYRVTVTDRTSLEAARTDGELRVPPPGAAVLHEPVLLSERRPGGDPEYVVLPTHSYPAAPASIEFLLGGQVTGSTAVAARARLLPAGGDDPAPIATWEQAVTAGPDGSVLAYGSIPAGGQLGELRLEAALVDGSGAEIARASTPLLVAGVATWIAEHWKDVLALLRYEATKDELEILEDVDDPVARAEAWACFWRMRDPIPTTASNEAMLEYFQRIHTANEMWKSALRPGYQSDRGRVYMTLGQPSDIQRNPMPGPTHAYEVWTYERGKQFQIVFEDRIGFNNYQLASIGTYQRELAAIDRRKRQFLRDRAQLCPLLQPAFTGSD